MANSSRARSIGSACAPLEITELTPENLRSPADYVLILGSARKSYRSRRIRCGSRQSAAQVELPFELFSVALLFHDGTLLTMRRTARLQRPPVVQIYSRASCPSLLTSGATSERTGNLRTAGIRKLRQRIHESLETVCDSPRKRAFTPSAGRLPSRVLKLDCEQEQRRWS